MVKKKSKKPTTKQLKDRLWKLCREIGAQIYPHECYTCNVGLLWGSSTMQLGHFLAKSYCSTAAKYDMRNLRWQCRYCNQFRGGRTADFERRLIAEHGEEYVKEIKRFDLDTRGKMYRDDWYVEKIAEYKAILANLTIHR